MFGYFGEYLGDFYRMSALMSGGGDAAAYGRRRLAQPHRSDRRKKGIRAKAKRRARGKRRRK